METTVSKNRMIALTAALCALEVVLGMPPLHLGMIAINPTVSITIMQMPVLLAIILLPDFASLWSGMIVAFVFGVFSLVLAAISPAGALDPLFVNPLISILPRVSYAIVAWLFWKLFSTVLRFPKLVASPVFAFLSTLSHGCLVFAALYIFAASKTLEALGGKAYLVLVASQLPPMTINAIAAAILCTAVLGATTVVAGRKAKLTR